MMMVFRWLYEAKDDTAGPLELLLKIMPQFLVLAYYLFTSLQNFGSMLIWFEIFDADTTNNITTITGLLSQFFIYITDIWTSFSPSSTSFHTASCGLWRPMKPTSYKETLTNIWIKITWIRFSPSCKVPYKETCKAVRARLPTFIWSCKYLIWSMTSSRADAWFPFRNQNYSGFKEDI